MGGLPLELKKRRTITPDRSQLSLKTFI